MLRNCDWSRQFVDEVLSYRTKEVRPGDAVRQQCHPVLYKEAC